MQLRQRIQRGALAGLTLGALVSAATLMFFAWRTLQVDCATLGAEECTFEKETASQIARMQAFASVGLAFVGAGLALFLRRSDD